MAFIPPDNMFKIMTRTHIFLYRKSGGKIWNTMLGMPVLLLTTTGRKSGKSRTTPVVYVRDNGDYLIAASKGGADSHPAWYLNLEASSEAQIEIGDNVFTVQVTVTEGEERTQLFEKIKTAGDNFATYEQNTQRIIPVVRLTPKT